jgi:hypothetical protein
MMDEWYADNNGTGETVSIYAGGRLVADVYEIADAERIVREHTDVARLRAALEELIPFTEEMVDGAHRPADVPIMLDWPPLAQARQVLKESRR